MEAVKKRWLNLALGTIVMLFLGLIYAWSVFAAPLEAAFHWDRAQTSLTFTISIVFFVIGLIVSGFLSAILSKRVLMLISAASMLVGFVLCSRTTSLWQLYIFYGVLVGFGVGMANNALVSSIVAWFPEKRGVASGILMMGFGLGGLLLSNTAQSLMEQIGWQKVFFWFGIVFGIIIGLGSFLAKNPPEGFHPTSSKVTSKTVADVEDVPVGKVVKGATFWVYILWFAMVMAGGLLVIGHASSFAQDLGAAPSLGAFAAGILSLFNGIGRVITGITCDRFGLKVSMHCTTIYLLLASVLLVLAASLGSMPLLFAGYILAGLSYGGGPTTSSIFASSFYGSKYFSMNYAAASGGMIPGAILGPYLGGVLRASSDGYLTSFITVLIFGVVGIVSLQFLKKPAQK